MKQTAAPTTDGKLLTKYLQDHMVAAYSGVKLFHEASKVWQDTTFGPRVGELTSEIEHDRVELKKISASLGIKVPLPKKLLSRAAHTLSRLNPLNPTGSLEGLPGQLELEALHAAVAAKGCLWQTLMELSKTEPLISASRVQTLSGRAQDQQSRITTIIRETAAIRFRTDRSF